ncbi:caspase domain-containing protein [Desarmillaria tabescens]|uniref:Caspase domain-containing protein n=1 Tax=Armillaria tabescens TaxID=1929756 RepID=A0AA39TSI4_ARMTA|nr:caspase domain-containing protein [Desarmillaria tabescens]KAK0462344.1 caspase domain-containing protein [Desarmillaria tabescens]
MPLPLVLSTDQIYFDERGTHLASRYDHDSIADSKYSSSAFLPSDERRINIGHHHDHGVEGCLYDASRFRLPSIINHGLGTMRSEPQDNIGYSESPGRKRAVCIGINYLGQGDELHGCILDARNIRDFLIRRYCHGYKTDDIRMLTDDTETKPTKKNIIAAMSWLVQGAGPADSLFFHYSGHGDQTDDQNGDEVDGKDEEIICFDSAPFIDDDIHKVLVDPLPPGCKLTALFDSCHSGTILDLPYIYDSHGRPRRECTLPGTDSLANVICWSGAKDDQQCFDSTQGGVMTQAFIKSLEEKPKQSYRGLLHSMRKIVERRHPNQNLQLTSSRQMDTNMEFIF